MAPSIVGPTFASWSNDESELYTGQLYRVARVDNASRLGFNVDLGCGEESFS